MYFLRVELHEFQTLISSITLISLHIYLSGKKKTRFISYTFFLKFHDFQDN
jgi:hypothetical protein